jgi:hypothetical protein
VIGPTSREPIGDTSTLDSAWDSFTFAVDDVPDDASVSDALNDVSQAAQSLLSTTKSTLTGPDCSSSREGARLTNTDDDALRRTSGSATEIDSHVVDERTLTGERPSGPRAVAHFTSAERAARGRAERAELPRSAHADWQPGSMRRDPVELLEEQAQTRLPELGPRYGRMLVSPFTFLRGGAYLENGFDEEARRSAVIAAVREYRESMARFAEMRLPRYLGSGASFDRADQNDRDYRALREAAASGRVRAEIGV